MNREKIIELAKSVSLFSDYPIQDKSIIAFYHAAIANFLQTSGQYVTNDASREAVIKQAKAEAFELAAKECELRFSYYNRGACGSYEAENCAAAIREMAKEMK